MKNKQNWMHSKYEAKNFFSYSVLGINYFPISKIWLSCLKKPLDFSAIFIGSTYKKEYENINNSSNSSL